LFIREVERFSPSRGNERRIEVQAPAGANRFVLFNGMFDAGQDKLPGGAAPTRSRFMQPPVEIARQID
jgi:hypothetical protein